MKYICALLLALSAFSGCASTENAAETANTAGGGLSLLEAIEQSGEKIAAELTQGSRVAIAAFETENDALSDFIIEELAGALVDRGIEVADRQNLDYVFKELGFQWSGHVDDESAHSLGKFLAAEVVISGQLTDMGGSYRYRTNAVHVEKATRDSITRLTLADGEDMRRMLAAFAGRKNTAQPAKSSVPQKASVKTAGGFLDSGILFASRGDYTMAIAEFGEALKLDPNMAAAYTLRGRALFVSVSTVTKMDANFDNFTFSSADGQISVQQAQIYDQVITDFTQAIRLAPNNDRNYLERGMAHAAKSESDKAVADYNQALRLSPNYVDAYNNRGNVYLHKGDYDKAIADYNQAIRLNPNFASAYGNRGNAYLAKGNYDWAIADYTQAIRLNPDFAGAYHGRGNAYLAKGDHDKAIADYNQVIRLNPNAADMYSNRGNVYLAKGDRDRALADYNQAIRLNPDFPNAYHGRGNMYHYKGDYDKAIADYTQVIRITPNDADMYSNRGNSYYMKKDYGRAITDYESALRINPNHANAKEFIEIARRQQQRR